MLDDSKRAEMDQNQAALIELLPPLWWGLFSSCMKEGFNELQAMEILVAYVAAQAKA